MKIFVQYETGVEDFVHQKKKKKKKRLLHGTYGRLFIVETGIWFGYLLALHNNNFAEM